MRFKCYLTMDEKKAEAEKIKNWHRVFLWWPRTMSGDTGECVWLETVERRYPDVHWWDYDLGFKRSEYRVLSNET